MHLESAVPTSSRRRWRRIAIAVAAVASVSLVAACGGSSGESSSSGETRVISADNGDITVPADPQRVVATGYAVPPLIEADANLVGISTWERGLNLMTEEDRTTYDGLTKISGETAVELNYDAVASVKPDLIVIGVPKPVLGDIDVARLESLAPVVAIGPSVPAAWRELTQKQMDAAGRAESWEAAKKTYDEKAAGLKTKYADALAGVKFGHLGAYGNTSSGTFQREFADSWGTNIAQDIGVEYYGQVKQKLGGSKDVAENSAIDELPASFADAEVITYTVTDDGTPSPEVQYVLDSPLWKNLPAVKAGKVYALRYTEAATYTSALRALDAIDEALTPLLGGTGS